MPKSTLPGKQFKELLPGRVWQTEISFEQFITHAKLKDISKPVQQCALNNDKVQEMIEEYAEHPDYFAHKRIITIAYMEHDKETYYIVDGQHRIEMARQLTKDGKNVTDYVICIWHMLSNEADMRALFSSINKDSIRNQPYVGSDVFIQMRMDDFVKFFNSKDNGYKKLFATRASQTSRKYTIEEVVQQLHSDGLFNLERTPALYPDLSSVTDNPLTFVNYILDSAETFYEKLKHDTSCESNPNYSSQWYADEWELMGERSIWTLKTTNFFAWLKDKERVLPRHTSRYIKSRIPAQTRTAVWKKYYGNNTTAPCPLYHLCNVTLNRDVRNGWQCGHIISERNGGKIQVDNLRPICQGCNCSMGSNNWEDYEKSLGNN